MGVHVHASAIGNDLKGRPMHIWTDHDLISGLFINFFEN